jgi:gas vesicle structural protein
MRDYADGKRERGVTMAIATRGTSSNYLQRAPSPSGLAEVLDVILDKGLVIDAFVRVSVIGIELVTIDARIVIASVDTYLRFAEAVNRLELSETVVGGLPELEEIAAKEIAKDKVEDTLGPLAGKAPSLRGAAKGAAAAAAVAGAAAAAKALADRRSNGSDGDQGGT